MIWLALCKEKKIVLKTFEPDATSAMGNVNRIRALITKNTKVIQVSHITAPTGIVMPIEQIAALAQEFGLWFHVDGAQSVGQLQLDIGKLGCHSFGASCHKWMSAVLETGFVWIRKDLLGAVAPVEIGAYWYEIV